MPNQYSEIGAGLTVGYLETKYLLCQPGDDKFVKILGYFELHGDGSEQDIHFDCEWSVLSVVFERGYIGF